MEKKNETPVFFHPFLSEVEITPEDIAAIDAAVIERIERGEYHGSLLELFNAVAQTPNS